MKYKGYKILAEVPNTSGIWTLDELGRLDNLQREIELDSDIQYFGIETDNECEWFETLDELKGYIDEK